RIGRRRRRPARAGDPVLQRAGRVVAGPRARSRRRLVPPSRQARDRGADPWRRGVHAGLVPDGTAARRGARVITYAQAIVLGLLQGFSELFPISSLGHSVIIPQLLGWDIHQNDDFFVTFLVATHLATAVVLFCFFFGDWMRIFRGL